MKEGRKLEYPEKSPDDKLKEMPQIKAPKLKPHARLKPALYHRWQARKADTLTITPFVAPTYDHHHHHFLSIFVNLQSTLPFRPSFNCSAFLFARLQCRKSL